METAAPTMNTITAKFVVLDRLRLLVGENLRLPLITANDNRQVRGLAFNGFIMRSGSIAITSQRSTRCLDRQDEAVAFLA